MEIEKKNWDEIERSILGNFLVLAFSPNPLKGNVEVLVDGEGRYWFSRERFTEILKDTLDYSKEDSRNLIASIEVALLEFGGWFYVDRNRMLFSRLREAPPTEKLRPSDIREATERPIGKAQAAVTGVDASMFDQHNALLKASMMGMKKKKFENKAKLRAWGR